MSTIGPPFTTWCHLKQLAADNIRLAKVEPCTGTKKGRRDWCTSLMLQR